MISDNSWCQGHWNFLLCAPVYQSFYPPTSVLSNGPYFMHNSRNTSAATLCVPLVVLYLGAVVEPNVRVVGDPCRGL